MYKGSTGYIRFNGFMHYYAIAAMAKPYTECKEWQDFMQFIRDAYLDDFYQEYKKNINGTVVTMCRVELHTYLGIHLTDEEAETLKLLLDNILKSDVPEEYYLVDVNTATRYA